MVYLDIVMVLNFAVDLLLLYAANRLSGFPSRPWRCFLSAALGGVYGGICLLPGMLFLSATLWRILFLGLMASIAFGLDRSALRRGTLFVLLSMALGGIALGIGKGSSWTVVLAAGALCILCIFGFEGKAGIRRYVRVQLTHRGHTQTLTALMDTGNTLTDPITGESVLIVGSDIACSQFGLTLDQLSSPIDSLAALPGLRLIPYRAVGQPGGMLLALRPDSVRIGNEITNTLVAFAPNPIGGDGYQALAGGIL